MPSRSLPARPNLDQLKHQAKDLLKAYRAGDAQAADDFAAFHPESVPPARAKLADAQLVLARSYNASGWSRLAQYCELVDAIWNDEPPTVARLVKANPNLLTDMGEIRNDDWPPIRVAANLERHRIVRTLADLGARGLAQALDRAGLRGRLQEALGGAAYTLNVSDTEFLLRMGAEIRQGAGTPVETVIGSDSRRPADKRRILAIYEEHGYLYPDTPIMAFHRGRYDLLLRHLERDPGLLARTFAIEEIFPPEVGCGQQPYEAMGTPVDGGTLLHLAVYWDELDMATWLLDRGADPNARAAMDADGFGGFTPLFNSVVSQAGFWINYPHGREPRPGDLAFIELLLSRGADPGVRASIRMRLGEGHSDTGLREFRDVTPLEWGRRFSLEQRPGKHREILFVNTAAMRRLGG